ncbi:MAG: hypothetical protein MRY83_23610 [Flavobacteriales bacterium]|nr:hypothetical protein [Flavobacteriales bacterium]
MKNLKFLFLFLMLFSFSCKNKEQIANDGVVTEEQKKEVKKDPIVKNESCIDLKINEFKSSEKKNPPIQIHQYYYKDKVVYLVSSYCCDIPSRVFDESCNLVCEPDGGFTGNGDGRCSDFYDVATKKTLIWKDQR